MTIVWRHLTDWILEAINKTCLLLAMVLVPVLVTSGMHWVLYATTSGIVYEEPWMAPSILLVGTFFAGVLNRLLMESNQNGTKDGLVMLMLCVMAFFGFAVVVYMDVHTAYIYSSMLPRQTELSLQPYIYAIPAVGLLGMTMSRVFTLEK